MLVAVWWQDYVNIKAVAFDSRRTSSRTASNIEKKSNWHARRRTLTH